MRWESPYFQSVEMKCSHTDKEMMEPEFMEKLTKLRQEFARPMAISSAYRDPTHPIEAKKKKPGAHTKGRAVDVLVAGADALELVELALAQGFTGIGIAQKGARGSRFIHIDDLEKEDGFPRPTIWSY